MIITEPRISNIIYRQMLFACRKTGIKKQNNLNAINEKRLAIVNRFHSSHLVELVIMEKRKLKQKNPKQEK